jgi:ABC-type Fe3+-hydroxamate transport system substrate-binding protein
VRIVSLCPSITETLIDFGLADSLVGITRYCIHPREITRRLPKVGGTKTPDLDAIIAAAPDLVFMNEEENTKEAFEALRGKVELDVTFPRKVDEVPAVLRHLGAVTGTSERAERRARELEEALAGLDRSVAFRFAYLIWRDPWMAAAGDTYVSDLVSRAGGCNIWHESGDRYPTITLEDLRDRNPTFVLLPDEPYRFKEKDRLDLTRILPDARIELISGDDCSWHGVRSIRGVALVAALRAR